MPVSAPDWWSYEGIAGTYDEIARPHYIEPPAESLVATLRISSTDRVLDLGAGTGVAAVIALRRGCCVVAADICCSMLLRAKRAGVTRCVVSGSPRLCFADRSFDCVMASFVLNHVPDLDGALREIARVLRPGGKLGATSWAQGPSENEFGRAWSEIAGEFVDGSMLAEQVRRALPGEERLRDVLAIREALAGGGLLVRSLDELEFSVSIPTVDYVKSRSVAATARFMQSVLSAAEWDRFDAEVRERLISLFGLRLDFSIRVNVAIAATPAAD